MRWHHERRCRRRGLPCCARHEHRSGLLSHAQARTHTCAAQSRTVKPSRCGFTKKHDKAARRAWRHWTNVETKENALPRTVHSSATCPVRAVLVSKTGIGSGCVGVGRGGDWTKGVCSSQRGDCSRRVAGSRSLAARRQRRRCGSP